MPFDVEYTNGTSVCTLKQAKTGPGHNHDGVKLIFRTSITVPKSFHHPLRNMYSTVIARVDTKQVLVTCTLVRPVAESKFFPSSFSVD